MATAPTDDPLVDSDRTVGVLPYLDHASKSLKRQALLFDQIGVPTIDLNVVSGFDEVDWLREIGIVRDVPALFLGNDPPAMHAYLDAVATETGNPIDIESIPEQLLATEVMSRVFTAQTAGLHALDAVLSRLYCTGLRLDGINAFRILETRRQIGNVFPSGTTPVLEVVLKSMPIPDDQTPWQDIIEFRDDPDSTRRLRGLRV
jgi:hypothetical protein